MSLSSRAFELFNYLLCWHSLILLAGTIDPKRIPVLNNRICLYVYSIRSGQVVRTTRPHGLSVSFLCSRFWYMAGVVLAIILILQLNCFAPVQLDRLLNSGEITLLRPENDVTTIIKIASMFCFINNYLKPKARIGFQIQIYILPH